jgi:hypothetical protein
VKLTWIFAELLLNCNVYFIQHALVSSLLVFQRILLLSGLITVLQYHIPVKGEMEGQLVNQLISPVDSLLIRELSQVMGGLRVVGVQGFDDLFILLLLGQLLLVYPSHLVHLVGIQKIWVIIQILTVSLLLHNVVLSFSFCSFPLLNKEIN